MKIKMYRKRDLHELTQIEKINLSCFFFYLVSMFNWFYIFHVKFLFLRIKTERRKIFYICMNTWTFLIATCCTLRKMIYDHLFCRNKASSPFCIIPNYCVCRLKFIFVRGISRNLHKNFMSINNSIIIIRKIIFKL